ncbi:MAG TPA: metallophosphoesterase family protein [Candidatus Eremiobacteraceae bacterium]|nr:metallophosphoesterase family protein [Candidatus Eremiobacteraceae bacterium]
MRYGIISDVHSNMEALTAVLDELDSLRIDGLICLGDIVGYGPSPNECCATLIARDCVSIAGNHDEAAAKETGIDYFSPLAREAIEWSRAALSREHLEYLGALPRVRTIETFDIVHGAPVYHFDYILDVVDAQAAFSRTAAGLTFVGHSHIAEVYYQEKSGRTFQQRLLHGGRIDISDEYRYIVNPGSVGQPRDRNPQAAFAVIDVDEAYVDVRRVTYDVRAVQERIENARLPSQLGDRLALGY